MKLMHVLLSHVCCPWFLTMLGIFVVSYSSTRNRRPSVSFVRKPTTILGTPSRKDWIQNLCNLRSNLTTSLGLAISAAVLSSTQLIFADLSSGLWSHTACGSVVICGYK